jgi:hypothetical protein
MQSILQTRDHGKIIAVAFGVIAVSFVMRISDVLRGLPWRSNAWHHQGSKRQA